MTKDVRSLAASKRISDGLAVHEIGLGGLSTSVLFAVQEIKHLRAVVRSKEETLAETQRQLETEQAQVMELETQLLAQVCGQLCDGSSAFFIHCLS